MNDNFFHIPSGTKGFRNDTLDDLLAAGYYRMQHLMFTCNDTGLGEEGNPVPVFWLRTLVQQCRPGKSAAAILRKCSGFTTEVSPAGLNSETENLFLRYKKHVPFSVSRSVADYLHQDEIPNPFESLMVKVRDRGRLIAVGYFDTGLQAIAGIMNIYHPDYHQFSLGKLLMLHKLQYALSGGKTFYYTGYISTANTRFDYKTFPDPAAVQVFLPVEKEWVPYEQLGKEFLADYYLRFLM